VTLRCIHYRGVTNSTPRCIHCQGVETPLVYSLPGSKKIRFPHVFSTRELELPVYSLPGSTPLYIHHRGVIFTVFSCFKGFLWPLKEQSLEKLTMEDFFYHWQEACGWIAYFSQTLPGGEYTGESLSKTNNSTNILKASKNTLVWWKKQTQNVMVRFIYWTSKDWTANDRTPKEPTSNDWTSNDERRMTERRMTEVWMTL
jgi:hypothetical protein